MFFVFNKKKKNYYIYYICLYNTYIIKIINFIFKKKKIHINIQTKKKIKNLIKSNSKHPKDKQHLHFANIYQIQPIQGL
jgi:hypothetical protein